MPIRGMTATGEVDHAPPTPARVRYTCADVCPDVGGCAGLGQQAPLTPEYQARFEAGLKDLAAGGPGLDPSVTCLPPGMPRIMNVYSPMEIVVTPDTTYVL